MAQTYGLGGEKLHEMLLARGLKPIGEHFQYGALTKDLDACIQEAKALGLEYVACPWIPHQEAQFDEAVVHKAAADFNRWGEAFAKAGIKFTYHPHGYEFAPYGDGTMFDLLVKETDPKFVNFEMDVFWVMHPGKNPVELLEKYPNRWLLMHLKDIRKGAKTGVYTGHAPLTDDVPLGTGQVDWPAVFRAAAKVGVKHYFIEDESPTAKPPFPKASNTSKRSSSHSPGQLSPRHENDGRGREKQLHAPSPFGFRHSFHPLRKPFDLFRELMPELL